MTNRTCVVPGCTRRFYARSLCQLHYDRARRDGTLASYAREISAPTDSLDDRLRRIGWTATEAGCWEWRGARNPAGYGILAAGLRSTSGNCRPLHASRAAYLAWNGPIPEGLFVLHKCDNPPCINPDHLFIGDARDNSRDMVEKGRSNYGTRNPVHRFSNADVSRVRQMRESGATYQQIGDALGMSRHHASLICRGLRRAR